MANKLTYEEMRDVIGARADMTRDAWFDFLDASGWTGAELRERVMEERAKKGNSTPYPPCSLCQQHHDTRESAAACAHRWAWERAPAPALKVVELPPREKPLGVAEGLRHLADRIEKGEIEPIHRLAWVIQHEDTGFARVGIFGGEKPLMAETYYLFGLGQKALMDAPNDA